MFALQLFSDGALRGPVFDEDGPIETQHASTARRLAKAHAAREGCPVAVLRGSTIKFIMQPDGTVSPPPLAIVPERERCTRGTGRACFCTPCREERAGR